MKICPGAALQEGAWGGGNQFARSLVDYLHARGVQVYFDLNEPDLDLIMLVEPRAELRISACTDHEIRWYTHHINPRALVVHRINECDERKNSTGVNDRLIQANSCADHTVFISSWLRDLFHTHGLQKPAQSVILNGADSWIFHARGYHQWDGKSPVKLVTHHWGTNWLKGFDIYQQLDTMLASDPFKNRIEFTYIGQLPDDFAFKNTRYLEPLSGSALANTLREHHIYLTASQNEPAGMHHIEGAMCGLPLLYRESGALPEYCTGFGVGFTAENFVQQLETMLDSYDQWQAKMPDYPHTAGKMCENYYNLFVDLLNRRDEILAQRQERITLLTEDDSTWMDSLHDDIKRFLDSVQVQNGRYLPALEGLTDAGELIELPFSCFALKIYYTLGLWDELSESERQTWIAYIQNFQVKGNPLHTWTGRNAFIDIELFRRVRWQTRRRTHWKNRLFFPKRITYFQAVISAEAKQAVATLAEVGIQTQHPYKGFPTTPRHMKQYLANFDWRQPWEAGAHLATLAVFLHTEAPRLLQKTQVDKLRSLCNHFIDDLSDSDSGAYFKDEMPEYGQLINGAMKILTALDWLEKPIHHPKKLIDTVLTRLPLAEGCHVVDAVYVLYRCLQQTDHRHVDIEEYCCELLAMIREHHKPDGGFSYYMGYSQPHYHRVHITYHHPVSDLHGTLLLTWAAAMIRHILGYHDWRIIKP